MLYWHGQESLGGVGTCTFYFGGYVDNLIKGLQILNKYAGCEIAAEHDIIYVGLSDAFEVSKKDANL